MRFEAPRSDRGEVDVGDRGGQVGLPPRPELVHVAVAFTILFTALHLYWAVGGSWGLPLAAQQDEALTKLANWVVSVVMLVGAVWVLALNHPVGRRVPAWVLLVPVWVGAVVCASHAVFGLVTKSLYLSGYHGAVDFPVVPGVGTAEAAGANHLAAVQDLLVFEPCFLVQGLVLALAAWQFVRTPDGRRRWSMSLAVGIVVVDVFGALLSLGDLHVAIS